MDTVDSIKKVPREQLILGFGFLYERLVDILDGTGTEVSAVVIEPDCSGLDTAVGPLVPDPIVVQAHRPAMARLRARLTPLAASGRPQADAAFRQLLIELREALEHVYGQRLTFTDEQRAPAPTRPEVTQEIDTVRKAAISVGAEIASDWAGHDVTVTQKVHVVEGTAIGAQFGGDRRKYRQ